MIDPSLLGNILIDMGVVGEDALKEQLSVYNNSNHKHTFGVYLVNQKVITNNQLQVALLRQKIFRNRDPKKHVVPTAKRTLFKLV